MGTHNEHIAKGQFGLPVPLKCVYAHCARQLLHIGVPDAGSERRLGRAFRIVLWHLELESPEALGVRCTGRARQKDRQLR